MGLDRFYIPFENPQKIRSFFNVLTTLNIIFSLVPVILIDVYGLAKYRWGNQFYVMLIETLVFSLSMIVVQIIEYRSPKVDNPYLDAYQGVNDYSD
jgi:K+-transporting ATPase A subunit